MWCHCISMHIGRYRHLSFWYWRLLSSSVEVSGYLNYELHIKGAVLCFWQGAVPPVSKHLHIVWPSHWFTVPYCKWNVFLISGKPHAWSVFRWDLNVEQAKEVFHAAHECQFALIEQWTASDATYICTLGCDTLMAVTASLVDICVWILFMCYQKLKVSCMVVFRDEGNSEPTAEVLSKESRTNLKTWKVMRFYPTLYFLK